MGGAALGPAGRGLAFSRGDVGSYTTCPARGASSGPLSILKALVKGEAWPRPLGGLRRAPGRGRWLASLVRGGSRPCPVLGLGLQGQGRRLGAVSGREGPLARLHSAVCVGVWACGRVSERASVWACAPVTARFGGGSACNKTGGIQSLPRPPCKSVESPAFGKFYVTIFYHNFKNERVQLIQGAVAPSYGCTLLLLIPERFHHPEEPC